MRKKSKQPSHSHASMNKKSL